jgi:hypothetical protein
MRKKEFLDEKIKILGTQDHKAEWQAWRNVAKIIGEKDATNHVSGCGCDLFSCRLFNAVRAWGAELVDQAAGGKS